MAGEFIKKLSQIQEIGPSEDFALRETFARTRRAYKGETVFSQGGIQDQLYIVKSGWFFSYAILTDGSRQIHEVFTAGDVIGTENLSWSKATASVACAVAGELYTAPISETRSVMQRYPRLAGAFRALLMVHNTLLIDRLTAVARLDAYNRIAFFLSDALARQNLTAETRSNILQMPLSQNLIADALGLSSVHVSRQFGKLIKLGLIQKIGRKNLKVLNIETLQALGDYKNRFENLGPALSSQSDTAQITDSVFAATQISTGSCQDLPV